MSTVSVQCTTVYYSVLQCTKVYSQCTVTHKDLLSFIVNFLHAIEDVLQIWM